MSATGNQVLVPVDRWPRWVENFTVGHGPTALTVVDGALHGAAEDGSHFTARPPFDRAYAGPADVGSLLQACDPPAAWGVLLVRKGGYAVARLEGRRLADSKTGRRHVQGRTKAGGQSQQRFARRRDNQARAAYEAAAGHGARVLDGARLLVTGGDHEAVDAVLADGRLRGLEVVGPWLAIPDPRRDVLEQAVVQARSLRVTVHNA